MRPGARPLQTEAIPAGLLDLATILIAAPFDTAADWDFRSIADIHPPAGHPEAVWSHSYSSSTGAKNTPQRCFMSSKGFEKWGRILGDENTVAALLDRLLYPSGPSIHPMIDY